MGSATVAAAPAAPTEAPCAAASYATTIDATASGGRLKATAQQSTSSMHGWQVQQIVAPSRGRQVLAKAVQNGKKLGVKVDANVKVERGVVSDDRLRELQEAVRLGEANKFKDASSSIYLEHLSTGWVDSAWYGYLSR